MNEYAKLHSFTQRTKRRAVHPLPPSVRDPESLAADAKEAGWPVCGRKSQGSLGFACCSPLPLPCLFLLLSSKAPLSQVARSLASLLRPRVALGTSPKDVVPACLCAWECVCVSVCLCPGLWEDGRGGARPGGRERRRHQRTGLVMGIIVWTQVFPCCRIKTYFSPIHLCVCMARKINSVVDSIAMAFTELSFLRSPLQLYRWTK